MTKLVFINSCHNIGDFLNKFYGISDVELTDKGRFETILLSEHINNQIDEIITSPLKRCLFTAEFIKNNISQAAMTIDESLIDINGGDWEDLTIDEIFLTYQQEYINYIKYPQKLKIPNGEEFESVYNRTKTFAKKILNEKNKEILIISHDLILRNIFAHILNKEITEFSRLKNASITEFIIEKDNNQIIKLNSSEHLTEL